MKNYNHLEDADVQSLHYTVRKDTWLECQRDLKVTIRILLLF